MLWTNSLGYIKLSYDITIFEWVRVFLLLNNDDKKCKQSSTKNYRRHVQEHFEKIKINLIIENK